MFWIGFVIGTIIGGNIALLLYACVIVGKESDAQSGYRE